MYKYQKAGKTVTHVKLGTPAALGYCEALLWTFTCETTHPKLRGAEGKNLAEEMQEFWVCNCYSEKNCNTP